MKKIIALSGLALQIAFLPMANACPEGKGGHRGGPIKELDKNGDEQLSLDEVKDKPHLSEKFAEIDADKDGQLTRDEIKAHKKANKPFGRKGEKPVPAE